MAITTAATDIEATIEAFTAGIPAQMAAQYDKVIVILKELTLTPDGLIKQTVANMRVLTKVRQQLATITEDPSYLAQVGDLNNSITKIADAKTEYFSGAFNEFSKPPVIERLQKNAINGVTNSLTEAGINENVVGEAVGIVEQSITSGSSFTTLVNNLEVNMLGNPNIDPRMVSYSKQIMTDTISGFTRDYNSVVTRDLGLVWYRYVGAKVKTTRPFCAAMLSKEWVHESELGGIARGMINGVSVSTAGMMSGTTSANIISRCGGYNCNHELIPVDELAVPKKIRKKFEKVD